MKKTSKNINKIYINRYSYNYIWNFVNILVDFVSFENHPLKLNIYKKNMVDFVGGISVFI